MRAVVFITVAVFLAGCASGADDSPVEVAERRIAADLNEMFPGIDAAPAAACLTINATTFEIEALARREGNSKPLTQAMFERPESLSCLQANGVIEVVEFEV